MQSLVDQRVNLSLLSRAAVRWQELLGDAPQGAARFALFRALAGELTETRRRCSATVEVATRTLTQQPSTPIAVLAGRLGVTRQYLARLFAAEVGLSPKMFARVARLRRTLQRARESVTVDWADLAVGHGFSDQAHLAGEFRELVGLTPTRWFASERVKVPILQEEPAAVQ
jgi:AraC-like DNA-binding protein